MEEEQERRASACSEAMKAAFGQEVRVREVEVEEAVHDVVLDVDPGFVESWMAVEIVSLESASWKSAKNCGAKKAQPSVLLTAVGHKSGTCAAAPVARDEDRGSEPTPCHISSNEEKCLSW